MITAKEARELSGPTVQEQVENLGAAIKERAVGGYRSLRTGYDYKADEDLWIRGGYSGTKEWNTARALLEKAGFTVTFFYEERQFVDMYTLISW